ncbi:MAG: response regulator [Pseudomonadota bacterium]
MDTLLPWVAVVDDEEAIRRALLRLLRSAGIEARAFAGGADLLAALRDGAPYCAVLDMHMPGMSGCELQARLARDAPDTGVVVVTGHHSAELQARAMQGRPVAYLLKPMNDRLLLEAIAAARAAWRHA